MTTNVEYKVPVDKLEGPDDWAKWKWHMNMVFCAHGLETIIDGSKMRPSIPDEATEQQRKQVTDWKKEDAKAASIIASALSKSIAELVLTCTNAKEIWDKLCARFERSSTQRLNMLIESFFQAKRDEKEDISTHVAKLQKLFVDLNTELAKHNENTLSERMLNGRILSTLSKEFDNFKDLWDIIPTDKQKLNLLIEKLCAIELRETNINKATSSNNSAFVANRKYSKKKYNNRDQEVDEKREEKKKKFPCKKCKELGHWIAECPQNKTLEDKNTSKGKTSAFITYSLGASNNINVNADSWCCDSGASRHITPSKQYFISYTKFTIPEIISLGRKDATMQAYGKGTVNIQVYLRGRWYDAKLKEVWYVPDASTHLFSVKAAARNGFITTMDDKGVQIRNKKNRRLSATGFLSKELYIMNMRVSKPVENTQVNIASTDDMMQTYHERFAHQNKRHVKQILKRMNIDVANAEENFCDGCALGKMHRLSFKHRTNRPKEVGELIHADVNGPMETTSLGGARYYVCFKDDYSKFRRIFFLKHKSEVCKTMESFLNEAKTNEHTVKQLRCDGGKEFDNKEVAETLAKRGIEQLIGPPYTPQQNGAAERENRTIVEAARSMLQSSKLPKSLWAEACNTAAYILNRTGKSSETNKTPYELWYDREIGNLDHLRIFGTSCYAHINKQFRSKFDSKSVSGHLVGYVNDKDGYRIWCPQQRKVICTHDVIFKPETICNVRNEIKVIETEEDRNDEIEEKKTQDKEQEETTDEETEDESFKSTEEEEKEKPRNKEKNQEAEDETQQIRRSTRNKKLPAWMTGEFAWISEAGGASQQNPNSYSEAIKSEESEKWLKAMHEELSSLKENETWELVPQPSKAQVIQNRWTFRIKTADNGTPRFKARLVAKEYAQKEGTDYEETYSPVARYDTVRALIAVAASKQMKLRQFDIKTAFLYGTLQEEVYLEQPEGFNDDSGRVCRLKRSLYGLKQAPRCWNRRFIQFMKKTGLKSSTADPCLFYRNKGKNSLYVVIYVDDGLVMASNEEEVQEFLQQLEKEFKISLGSLKNFLGIQIKNHPDGSITISQEDYIKKLLEKYRMEECNAVLTPATHEDPDNKEEISGKIPYREAIGNLMYLTTTTRPDIAFAVSKAARSINKPTKQNWIEIKRILKYLQGTSKYGIKYKGGSNQLNVYTDADFAGDTATRRSTSGMVALLSEGAISWTSQLQKSVALSTTEAEIVAASEGAKQLVWLSRLLSDLLEPGKLSPTLHVDNASAVKLAKNPEFHKRTKHIEVRHFYVRERVTNGDLNIKHIEGKEQLADLLTKPLERIRYNILRKGVGVCPNEPTQ